MKKNSFLWAALSMTAALVMTACTNDDNTVETPAAPQAEVKTIPYTVTVGQGGDATTRATVADDPSDATNYHKTLYFATGDKLYISSDSRTDLKGTLTLKAGDEGKSNGATFEGSITYTGDAPEGTTEIKATLVGSSNVGVQITDGKVTGVSYPLDAYCDDVADAVQKYSNLTGTSTYSSKSFTLTQQTAFLNFVITFEDGTVAGETLSAVVSNGGSAVCTANVTTVTDGVVKAKFVLPVAKGTMLSSANVKMGSKAAISFGASQTLDGKVYNVKKTQAAAYTMAAAATSADKGKLICADGHIHANGADAACTKARVAKIIYIGTTGHATYTHGLALALTDEGQMAWQAAIDACSAKNTSTPVTDATWLLASKDQWDYMMGANGAGSNTALRDGFSGITGASNLQSDYYWSSTEGGSSNAWLYHFGIGNWFNVPKDFGSLRYRACLAF